MEKLLDERLVLLDANVETSEEAIRLMCAGKTNLISHEEMQKAFERSKTYGQVPDKK